MTNRTEVSFEDFPVTGSMTGTFLGADVEDVSFFGSASWADTSRTASTAETASFLTGFVESASFAATASIVLGGTESASFASTASIAFAAPTIIPVPSFLDQLRLINIQEAVEEIEGTETIIRLNLENHGFSRLAVTVTQGDENTGRPRIALQFSTDGGATFDFLDGGDGPYVDVTGSAHPLSGSLRVIGPVVAHVSESRTNVFLRAVTYSGSATAPFESPTCFALYWFAKLQAEGL